MTEKNIRLAAAWIYRNRHTGYWTYPILVSGVSTHPEVQKLQLSPDDANAVFGALEGKGFLRKMDNEQINFGPYSVQKYAIDFAKLTEFRDYADLPFYYGWFSDSTLRYLETWKSWLLICAALFASSFFGVFIGKIAEALWGVLFN